jgi:hypothetical protein
LLFSRTKYDYKFDDSGNCPYIDSSKLNGASGLIGDFEYLGLVCFIIKMVFSGLLLLLLCLECCIHKGRFMMIIPGLTHGIYFFVFSILLTIILEGSYEEDYYNKKSGYSDYYRGIGNNNCFTDRTIN